jgi:hypothetical protein
MILERQTLLDTRKRTVIKLVGQGPGDDAGNVAVNVSTLSGYAPLSVVNIGNVALITIKQIKAMVSVANGHVRLIWRGANANANIATFGPGSTMLQWDADQAVIPNNATGPNGDILVSTNGFVASNHTYTLIIDIRKDPKDGWNPGYDQIGSDFNHA